VNNSATTHEAWGPGVYCYFNVNTDVKANSGIEAPVNANVKFHDMVTASLGGVGEITHVIIIPAVLLTRLPTWQRLTSFLDDRVIGDW
jgi:hypothetical protein